MSYYDTFLAINRTPKEYYLNQIQQMVLEEFDNSSTVQTDVEEEKELGSFEFAPCESRVVGLVDVKSGKKSNDDFKKLIFKDVNHQPVLGIRYRFSNNIWLAISTDNIKSSTASVYIQRCNSTLNMQDNYGNIHQEPCCVDYNLMETKKLDKASIDVPMGRIEVKFQLNQYTKDIDINRRFILGQDAYKLRTRNQFERNETFNQDSVTIMSFYADYDGIADDDNLEYMIANYKVYNYSVSCLNEIKNIVGTSNTLTANVFLDGNLTNENVLWYSSDTSIATIDEGTGAYTLNAIGTCVFTCKMQNNPNFYTTINVSVVDTVESVYQDIITPDVTYLSTNQTQLYEVFEYKDGIKTDTTFTIQPFDVPIKNYKFSCTNNSFTVTNLKYTENIKLRIVCHNNRTSLDTTIQIELGGMF